VLTLPAKAQDVACTDETFRQYMCGVNPTTGTRAPGFGQHICKYVEASKKCEFDDSNKVVRATALLNDVCSEKSGTEGAAQCTASMNLMNVYLAAPAKDDVISATSQSLLTVADHGIATADKTKVKVAVAGTCAPGPKSWFPKNGGIGMPGVATMANYKADKKSFCTGGPTNLPYAACKFDTGACKTDFNAFGATACKMATYSGEDPCTAAPTPAAATTTTTAAAKKSSIGVRSLSVLLAAGVSMVAAIMA